MPHEFHMLQVWKITVPTNHEQASKLNGWALAETAEEAKSLSGYSNAVINREPERLWIAKERVVWVPDKAA